METRTSTERVLSNKANSGFAADSYAKFVAHNALPVADLIQRWGSGS